MRGLRRYPKVIGDEFQMKMDDEEGSHKSFLTYEMFSFFMTNRNVYFLAKNICKYSKPKG